jgi:membrane protein YdbS with pleckstrin-like domain
MQSEHFPRLTPFKPSEKMVTWFIVDFFLLVLFLLVCFVSPVILIPDVPLLADAVIAGFILVVVVLYLIWVKMYYDSMWYELHDDEMRWRRGVIFRSTGIVPYNRITNIDIKQGPVMRALGISTVSIQTAGYSGAAAPEIRIEAIVYADELRELIRNLVRSCSAGGDGTGTGKHNIQAPASSVHQQMLEELKAIHALLERKIE